MFFHVQVNALKTGLFSSIIATFIAISLPQLSADSNAPTVLLLSQLVNMTAETAGVSVRAPDIPTFQAPAPIVRVNVLWCLSLILSLSCALLATLMQQWARRYMVYALHRSAPRKQARIRAYMFDGVMYFRMSQAVEAIPLLLHTSVFLFFAGLIDFLFTYNNAVARYTLGCVVFFASIYAILTLLPHWRLNCPYRTPLSWFTYYSFQLSLSGLLSVVKVIEGGCHGLLLDLWRWTHPRLPGSRDHGPTKWREVLEEKFDMFYERLRHSVRWRVVLSAMEAPPSVDIGALHWTLTTLGENQKIEDFATNMPGFFNSTHTPDTPDATSAMLSLMFEQPNLDPILGTRLHELLKTCLPGASHLSDNQRISRLCVCLTSLWYYIRASNLPDNLNMPLAPYVRAVFASSDVIRWIWTEQDFAVRLLGRCFGSLVVKKLASDLALPARQLTTAELAVKKSASDIASPARPPPTTELAVTMSASDIALSARTPTAELAVKKPASDTSPLARIPTTAELSCLKTILGATGEEVWHLLNHKGAIDLENVTLLASAELKTLVKSGTNGVPADVVDVFQQTLHILGERMFSIEGEVEWKVDQVAKFRQIYFTFIEAPVPRVLKERLGYIWDKLPPNLKMPTSELYSATTSSPGTYQKRVDLVRTEGAPDSGYAEASAEGILSPISMPALPSESG